MNVNQSLDVNDAAQQPVSHPIFGPVFGERAWCLHCGAGSPSAAWQLNRWHCPRPGCDGGPLDAWRVRPLIGAEVTDERKKR